jgi:dolichol kinase
MDEKESHSIKLTLSTNYFQMFSFLIQKAHDPMKHHQNSSAFMRENTKQVGTHTHTHKYVYIYLIMIATLFPFTELVCEETKVEKTKREEEIEDRHDREKR